MTHVVKSQLVSILERIGIALELDGASPFEVLAFKNGAEHLRDWEGDLEDAVAAGTLTDIDGIGKGIAGVITELVTSGRSSKYEELCRTYPETLFDLFEVPGLGVSKVKRLHAELGVDSLDALQRAAEAGRVRALSGFGAKSEARILGGIAFARRRLGG